MRAFGHEGGIEAGGKFEWRVRTDVSTKFADFVWPGRALIEMKRRGENLANHYQQAFEYWLELVPNRPAYVILCNFDEIWIYDLNKQLREPVERLLTRELLEKDGWKSLRFLMPQEQTPKFSNDRVKVTREAADLIAEAYNAMVSPTRDTGRISPEVAQRYILQVVVAIFSEDAGLLPDDLFTNLLSEARRTFKGEHRQLSYDLIGGLFRQMNEPARATGGRFQEVDYFNGGLFETIQPVELTLGELNSLYKACSNYDWSQVEPEIFGTLFQDSMGKEARHAYGAHYTRPVDIMKVVVPTIVRPWQQRIRSAASFEELATLQKGLTDFKVLDPACGSGNFLYIAYTELKAIERSLVRRLLDVDRPRALQLLSASAFVSTRQFYGMDILPFAVELAKVTLMIAKELTVMNPEGDDPEVVELVKDQECALPLDNLDSNILCSDALFEPWPEADSIIGNPPFQSKNKLQKEIGPQKAAEIRARFPGVPGRADLCVYWLRLAHDHLRPGGQAGLVGTNTIRQNYSRQGGLDYIVSNGGTIIEAVSSQPWAGDAVVHVSIVNWIKGEFAGRKRLFWQNGEDPDGPVLSADLDYIGPSLTAGVDVSRARRLSANAEADACYQGQTHGHKGFLLTAEEAQTFVKREPASKEVLFPYLTADELLDFVPGRPNTKRRSSHPIDQSSLFMSSQGPTIQERLSLDVTADSPETLDVPNGVSGSVWYPERYVIDFGNRDVVESSAYRLPFDRVKQTVLSDRERAFQLEKERNKGVRKGNRHHANFYNRWWQMSWARSELMEKLSHIPRYVVCGRVTKRPIFEFITNEIHPNDALVAFPLPDDYSFGILQSDAHWHWFTARCSTLKADPRYTSETVFDSFPWPQRPSEKQVRLIADAAVELRMIRREMMAKSGLTYRKLYRTLELPGKSLLRDVHGHLDKLVRDTYGIADNDDILEVLLNLNIELSDREKSGSSITSPGLPDWIADRQSYVSSDCVHMPANAF